MMSEIYSYSPETRGFYLESVHGSAIPSDAVPVSAEQHSALMAAQAAGATITPGADGHPIAVPHPAPTPADLAAQGAAIVQAHLDATARLRRYDSIQTAVSYRGDPNPAFAAEALALSDWRSAVWTTALALLAEVEAGSQPVPTPEALIAALPPMVWPT